MIINLHEILVAGHNVKMSTVTMSKSKCRKVKMSTMEMAKVGMSKVSHTRGLEHRAQ